MRPKILVVIKNLDGGTGTFLLQILKLKSFDFRVCALEKPRYANFNLKIFYFFSKKPSHLVSYGLNPFLYFKILREFFWLLKIVRKERPKLILSIDTHCNILSSVLRLLFRDLKVIITTHNNLSAVVSRKLVFPLRFLLRYSGRYLFNRVDEIVCVSDGVGKDFKKFFSIKGRIEIIPYGLNLSEINKLKSKSIPIEYRDMFKGQSGKIISIGRFEEQKDFATLIKAFAKVAKKAKDAELILIGDGGQRSLLESLVREQGIEKHVHFLGWQTNIYPILRSSNLFVLSSNFEGFGYVLLEAMSQGLPVISTDSPFGPREVLDNDKYGILVPGGNIGKMKNAILKVLTNISEHKKYSLRSQERIKFYTEEKMLSAYKNLIENTRT